MSRNVPRPSVHVVAAAVIDPAGRVLIAQRPEGKHLAGGWEFPGGKLEPGEERRMGLARELREELGITIGVPRPLMRVRHAYPTRDVLLDMWVVRDYHGEPQGLDGQALRWCAQDELATVDLLPADAPIVAALRLPERLWEISTPYYAVDTQCFSAQSPGHRAALRDKKQRGVSCSNTAEAMAAVGAGADFLVVRTELTDEQLAGVCEAVPLPVYGRRISLEAAWALGASGINEIPLSLC